MSRVRPLILPHIEGFTKLRKKAFANLAKNHHDRVMQISEARAGGSLTQTWTETFFSAH